MDRRSFVLSSLAVLGCGSSEGSVNEIPGASATKVLAGSAPAYTGYASNSLFSDLAEGMKVSGRQFRVRDYEIRNMNGACIDYSASPNWQDFGVVDGCYLHDSYKGIYTHNGGEGLLVSNTSISNCVYGVHVDSGNNNFANGESVFCSIGIKISGGVNNAHGCFTNWTSRHNAYLLTCQDVTFGESFVNCNFIGGQAGTDQGAMQLLNSKGIAITGGQIASCDISVDAMSQLDLSHVTFRGPVNVTVAAGGVFKSYNPVVMSGATLTLNGVPWNGSS